MTDRQTNAGYYITFVAEVIMSFHIHKVGPLRTDSEPTQNQISVSL